MMPHAPKILWIIPEIRGGILSYSRSLAEKVREESERNGFHFLEPIIMSFGDPAERDRSVDLIVSLKPDVIHLQHEYSYFGRKTPPFYHFKQWFAPLKKRLPNTVFIATSHTVLGPEFRYVWKGRGIRAPFFLLANILLVPFWRQVWNEGTFSEFDGVFVHSRLQKEMMEHRGLEQVRALALAVPDVRTTPAPLAPSRGKPRILLFGYFTLEKGQDVAIEAMRFVSADARLVLAGSVRREEDRPYFQHCMNLIEKYGLQEKIELQVEYIPDEAMAKIYAEAAFVIAPFRETSGSASLAEAFSRGKAILASDLRLNRELSERVPGCLHYFRSLDAESCAKEIDHLLSQPDDVKKLEEKSLEYARKFSRVKVAEAHVALYAEKYRDRVPSAGRKIENP